MQTNPYLWLKISLILGLVLSLSSCSSRLVYNQLDWLIPLYAKQYVTLDSAQKKQLKHEVKSLLEWHRTEQLPEYKRLIDSLITQVKADPQPAVIEQHFTTIEKFTQTLQRQAAHQLLPLLLNLSQQQKTELLDALRDKNQQFATNYVEIGEADARAQTTDKLQSQLNKWLGYLTPQQQLHIQQFTHNYQWIAPASFDARKSRINYIEHQLNHTPLTENAWLPVVQQLTEHRAFWDDNLIQAFTYNKQLFSQMLAAVLRDSEPKQIDRLIKRLEGYKKL